MFNNAAHANLLSKLEIWGSGSGLPAAAVRKFHSRLSGAPDSFGVGRAIADVAHVS